jgi:hypothetical protein
MDAAIMSVRELKRALDECGADYTGCTEKHELVARLAESRAGAGTAAGGPPPLPADPAAGGPPPLPADPGVDFEASLAQMNNLLDTLPGALTLLDKKWSDARSQKVRGQLSSIKEHLDRTASAGATDSNWQAKLAEYNDFAKQYKRLRDLPRNMDG